MPAFRVKDLLINVVPQRVSGGGGTSMPAPDGDIDDFPTPITPVIAVARFSPRLRVIDQYAGKIDQLRPELLEELAYEVGRAAVGAMFMPGAALCTQDMPTCAANEWISRFASLGEGLRFEDLVLVKGMLSEAVDQIDRLEASKLDQARGQANELVPQLEAALDALRGSKMG